MKLKTTILCALLFSATYSQADIITDTVVDGKSISSIELSQQQAEFAKLKNMDLSDPNFIPSDYFKPENKDLYHINLPFDGTTHLIANNRGPLDSNFKKSIEYTTLNYTNTYTNCRSGQSITRQLIDDFQTKYKENQEQLNFYLRSISDGFYSDGDLLSIEMLLRSEFEAYRCVYMNAAINIVEQQDYVSQVKQNLDTIQKRNYILRNTFDILRYIYLGMPSDEIIKNRIF